MKSVLITTTLLFVISMAGQSTAPSADKTHRPHTAATAPSAEHNMHAMMNQCMESMSKALPTAEKNLAEMKAALAQMKTDDPAAKRLAELNIAMWETEVAHMKEMAAMHVKMTDGMKAKHDEMTKTK